MKAITILIWILLVIIWVMSFYSIFLMLELYSNTRYCFPSLIVLCWSTFVFTIIWSYLLIKDID